MSFGRRLVQCSMFLKRKTSQRFGVSSFFFPSVTTHAKKSRCFPRTVIHRAKKSLCNRNSERSSYHTDLSRVFLPICDTSALSFSQFVGFQNSPYLSKIEKVAEMCEFDGKERLFCRKNHRNLNNSSGMNSARISAMGFPVRTK